MAKSRVFEQPPQRAGSQRLRPRDRIRRRPEFQRVYEQGIRISGRFMTLFVAGNELGFARLGIATPRRIGGAVQRNRGKRLIRELFRRLPREASIDLVVVARRELLAAAITTLEADYCSILRRYRPRRSGAIGG